MAKEKKHDIVTVEFEGEFYTKKFYRDDDVYYSKGDNNKRWAARLAKKKKEFEEEVRSGEFVSNSGRDGKVEEEYVSGEVVYHHSLGEGVVVKKYHVESHYILKFDKNVRQVEPKDEIVQNVKHFRKMDQPTED